MSDRWIIVGAGSAGCVLANRLSADPNRHVTLLDAGPPLEPGNVPAGIDGASFFAAMAEPGRMYPDLLARRTASSDETVYQRGRGVGGSSAVNAMVALRGSDSLYRQWGWTDSADAWGQVQIPSQRAVDTEIGAVDRALLAADPRAERQELTRMNGHRVTAAQAYLWPVLARENVHVRPHADVHRVCLAARTATGVVLGDGTELEADHVVLSAGAIHSPVVLLRSGVDTRGVGHGLQDHPSVVFTLALREHAHHDPHGLAIATALHARHDSELLQLLAMSHLGPEPDRAGLGALMAAVMTPRGRAGSVSISAGGDPIIDFALLHDPHDVHSLVEAAKLGLEVLATPAFAEIVEHVFVDDQGTTAAALVDDRAIESWVTSHCGDYVHATSTCAMGTVVDDDFRVAGYQGLYVCDASVFPSIPDANTHLPTTMLAERFGLRYGSVAQPTNVAGHSASRVRVTGD